MHKLSTSGCMHLLDVLATVKHPMAIKGVPCTFRRRTVGESKLEGVVVRDCGILVLDKLIGGATPTRVVVFSLVGGTGVAVHKTIMTSLLGVMHLTFTAAQAVAAAGTMVFNYGVNNALTYRDQRRRGLAGLRGLASFVAACGLWALANVMVATTICERHVRWVLASLPGIVVGAIWNSAMMSRFTWGQAQCAR